MKKLLGKLFENHLGQIRYANFEWIVMRLALAVVFLDAGRHLHRQIEPVDAIRSPHGFANWFDFSFLIPDGNTQVLVIVFMVCVVLFALQIVPVLATGGMLLIHSLFGTFYMSQGAMHHTQQVVGMTLLGLFVATIWASIREKRAKTWLFPKSDEFRNTSIFFAQQMFAAGYVVTGLTKLVRSEGKWIEEVPNLVVQFQKNIQMEYYNTLETQDQGLTQVLMDVLTNWPYLGIAVFTGVLLLELLAFLALFNRSIMAIWGIALIAMHMGIGVAMKLHFVYNELLGLILFVNLPFWIFCLFQKDRTVSGEQ